MTHNSSANFKLIHFLLWIKVSHQIPNFEVFECPGENLPNSSCHFWKHKSVSFKFCTNFQCHQTQLLCTFLAQILYTLVKSSQLKCKFLRFSSVRFKIHQIPHVSFELTSQFLFKFFIILHCHDT